MTEAVRTPHEARKTTTATQRAVVFTAKEGALVDKEDSLAVEEPLEIRVAAAEQPPLTLSITMRTPGDDFELAAGFLHSERLVDRREDLFDLAYCLEDQPGKDQNFNVVTATVSSSLPTSFHERRVITNSSCGICGATSIEAVCDSTHPPIVDRPQISDALLVRFPQMLREGQRGFAATGGLHAMALFDENGRLLCLREDVGRHNALDKVIGWALLNGRLPLYDTALMVSGRVSFEIVQKAVRAGIGFICAVSAATSLAVALAESARITLIGFLRGEAFTIYSGPERLYFAEASR